MNEDRTAPPPSRVQRMIRTFGPDVLEVLLEGLAASGMAIAIFDPDDRLFFSCPSFREAFDVQEGAQTFASIVRHCHAARRGALIAADDPDEWLAAVNSSRRCEPNRRFEIDLADGRWMWATETTYNDGWLMLVLQDFTSLKMKQIGLETDRDAAIRAADTDSLTGLASRRAIMRYLEDCVGAARRDAPLAIALIDIDHFKRINDSFGHDAGDAALERFGRYCRQVFRGDDRIGRVGGEEFLLVMPRAGETAAVAALQRFRRHLHRASQVLPKRLSFTFSAGVAPWRPGSTGGDLYRAADSTLYRAKAEGRDRIVSAGDRPPDARATAGQGGY